MVHRNEHEKVRVHIMLFKDDVEFLEQEYGKNSRKPMGLSGAVSIIVHAKVLDMQAKAAEAYEVMQRKKEAEL